MSIDFFEIKCQKSTHKALFGLCDDENNTPAYIDAEDMHKWNAKVINAASQTIFFTAIDNCIDIRRENGEMDNRCDCMLTYPHHIVFVELKNKGANWKKEAIEQIEFTIRHFGKNHNLSDIKHKRAFVANKRHPNFQVIDNELKRKFWDKYHVRLNIDTEINI